MRSVIIYKQDLSRSGTTVANVYLVYVRNFFGSCCTIQWDVSSSAFYNHCLIMWNNDFCPCCVKISGAITQQGGRFVLKE